jgi:hypothetical protein
MFLPPIYCMHFFSPTFVLQTLPMYHVWRRITKEQIRRLSGTPMIHYVFKSAHQLRIA